MKFQVKLINIGRDKINQEYVQEAGNIEEIAQLTYHKIRRFLLSSDVSLNPDESEEDLWSVFAGFHKVGEVRIEACKEEQ